MPDHTLTFACGCTFTTWASMPAAADVPTTCNVPCVPDDPKYPCPTCAERGEPCQMRQSMSGVHAYQPIEWSENGGVRRVIQMRGTGSLEWEKTA